MATIQYDITIPLPIERVWAMFCDIKTIFPALTPPEQQMVLERIEPLPAQLGTEVLISSKSPIGRVKWLARYTEFVPPHAVVFGMEARFVDTQITGPFKSWVHSHEFEALDSTSTRCIDRITYTAPYGPLGWLANPLIIRPALNKMFAYRHQVMKGWK